MVDKMKLHNYRIEFMADGYNFTTWHILARNYLDAVYRGHFRMAVYMANNHGNMISFEVFSE